MAVDPVALGAQEDPVVEAGQGQAVLTEKGSEAILQLAALATGGLFLQALQGEANFPRASSARVALQEVPERQPDPSGSGIRPPAASRPQRPRPRSRPSRRSSGEPRSPVFPPSPRARRVAPGRSACRSASRTCSCGEPSRGSRRPSSREDPKAPRRCDGSRAHQVQRQARLPSTNPGARGLDDLPRRRLDRAVAAIPPASADQWPLPRIRAEAADPAPLPRAGGPPTPRSPAPRRESVSVSVYRTL